MSDLYKYGVAVHLYKPIIKRGVVDFAVSADWTPAAGDVKISKDGGAAANVTNLPTAITMGNTAMWDYSITATEMQAAKVRISVADTATKAVEDVMFEIDTYGNASAQHAVDFADTVRAGLTALPNVASGSAGAVITSGTGTAQLSVSGGRGDADVLRWRATAVAVPNTEGVPLVDLRAHGRVNTAQAGGSTSITLDSGASATNDLYNAHTVSVVSGTGAGQGGRVITAYVGSTKVATVTPAWATNPSSDSVFVLVPAGVSLEAWLRSAPSALSTGNVAADVKMINASSAAAVRQALAANEFIPGTVTNAGISPTTTVFEASDITDAAADHYVGREIYFTTGTLLGQRCTISAYSLQSGRGRFTVSALTSAPANAVTFIVV